MVDSTISKTDRIKDLEKRLRAAHYECSVCTDNVAKDDPRWYCRICYGVFHQPCIVFWAQSQINQMISERRGDEIKSPNILGGYTFRCPLCQNRNDAATTEEYKCYCGKIKDPKYDPALVPGSCGSSCQKRRLDIQCPHVCGLMCHPGPCPDCPLSRTQSCYCLAEEKQVGCSSGIDGYVCGNVCGKELSCGRHYCEQVCHKGQCHQCYLTRTMHCYCGANTEERQCTTASHFNCNGLCRKKKDCGHHECGRKCHSGECSVCPRTPARQNTCPCGKSPLWLLYHKDPSLLSRTECIDPIPTCGETCGLPLGCSTHFCSFKCHDNGAGEPSDIATDSAPSSSLLSMYDKTGCPPCKEIISLRCVCGANLKRNHPCFVTYLPQQLWIDIVEMRQLPNEMRQLMIKQFPYKCDKYCNKPLSCGRHQCEEICCDPAMNGHLCMKVCRRKASCGIHECGQLCHRGPCPPCDNNSYEPLYCRCRKTYLDPPVPCGTPPPKCNHPCSVPRPCGHPSNHNCHHPDEPCTQCTVLTPKYCPSHNTLLPFHHPCFIVFVSCGKRCGKAITCCGIRCDKICHSGECEHTCTLLFPDLATSNFGKKKKRK